MESIKTLPKRVYRTKRHIRWNWEPSPDHPDLVRYHFVVVDDKNRDIIMNSLLEKISKKGTISSPVKKIRGREGKVEGSGLRYLFRSYDSLIDIGDFLIMNKPVRKDPDLNEREIGNIEDYVERIYSNNHHKPL